jgi:hypothetical protein
MREAGIPEYRRDDLLAFVPWEEARTQHSGRQAIFVSITDAIGGIERMQRDRERRRLKIDTAWDSIRRWLEGLADARLLGATSSSVSAPQASDDIHELDAAVKPRLGR